LDDDDVDLERIFSRSSIVCFHGGVGTAAAAVSSTPAPALVVLPLHFDQHANARLLEAQFQAAHVSPEGDVTDDLHAAISSKLANRLVVGAHACDALGGDNAQASAGVERLLNKLLACERVSPKLTR
jgi:UDP:flavonoid glycosyltransferase YjiC (YdhE family)